MNKFFSKRSEEEKQKMEFYSKILILIHCLLEIIREDFLVKEKIVTLLKETIEKLNK